MSTTKNYLSDEQLEDVNAFNPAVSSFQSDWPLQSYDEQTPDFSEELLFSWVAPERIFRPRLSKDYLRNLILLIVLIILLLIFTNQFYLLTVVLALVFLYYALVNVPPKKVRHAITNYGIYTHDHFYPWLSRGQRFWFEENFGQKQVIVETQIFPYRLVMLVGHARNYPHIKEVMSHYLIMQKPAPTRLDKWVDWWRKKFPLG